MRLLTPKSDNLRDATERSLTLLRVFLAASALILAVGRSCSAPSSRAR